MSGGSFQLGFFSMEKELLLLEKGGPTAAVLFFFPPAEGITSCWYICIWEISFLIGCNGFSI